MYFQSRQFTVYHLALCCIIPVFSIRNLQGHLKPLGSHTPPKIDVDEFTIENAPSPAEFYEKYVKRSKAAIFRSAIKGSRAFNLWTDEYIRVHYGEMEVRLEGKHEKHHVPPVGEKYLGRDTLRHFVDTYHDSNDNTYIVSDLPSPMYKDVDVVPSLGACGEMSRRIIEVDIWWSGGGTSSILHKDAFHQMNCLVNGTKNWKLIEYKYEKYIHKHPEPESELGGFSDIDPQAVDLIEHPHISKTEWSNVTIYAGDCLYLPKSYYHQVESHGTNNLAISLLFARFDNRESLDFSDCTGNIDYQKARPLSEYNVQLVWKGTGMMVMGRSDLEEQYRASLLKLTNDHESKGKLCNLESIEKMFWEIAPPEGQRMLGDMNKAFLIMDKNKDGYISNKEITALTIDELRLIGDEVSMYEPSNSYKFEYSIISFENVWAALHYYLHEYDSIDRDLWISKYKLLGGTEEFGDEIFDKLSSGKTSIISKHITEDDIWNALENWIYYWAPQYSDLPHRPEKKDGPALMKFLEDGEFDILEDQKYEEDKTVHIKQKYNLREEL